MNENQLGDLISSLYTQLLAEYRDVQKAASETARLINQLLAEKEG